MNVAVVSLPDNVPTGLVWLIFGAPLLAGLVLIVFEALARLATARAVEIKERGVQQLAEAKKIRAEAQLRKEDVRLAELASGQSPPTGFAPTGGPAPAGDGAGSDDGEPAPADKDGLIASLEKFFAKQPYLVTAAVLLLLPLIVATGFSFGTGGGS